VAMTGEFGVYVYIWVISQSRCVDVHYGGTTVYVMSVHDYMGNIASANVRGVAGFC